MPSSNSAQILEVLPQELHALVIRSLHKLFELQSQGGPDAAQPNPVRVEEAGLDQQQVVLQAELCDGGVEAQSRTDGEV